MSGRNTAREHGQKSALGGYLNELADVIADAALYVPFAAIAPFEYSPLLWGIPLGFLIWAEVPAWTTLAGAAIVIGAGLYNVHRERVRRAQERAAAKAG